MVSCKIFNIKKISCFLVSFLSVCYLFADTTYFVQKGDTLYSISRKYQLTVAELRAANNISEKDVLKAGQKLVIPAADISNAAALSSSKTTNDLPKSSELVKSTVTYIVQKGDTLYGISRKFSMKLPDLLLINNLDSNSTIKVGQKLKIYSSGSVGSVSSGKNDDIQKYNSKNDNKGNKNNSGSIFVEKDNKPSNSYKTKGILWPLENPAVQKIKGKVSGVELFGKDGENVKTVHEGTVMYTGLYRGFGEIVFVQSKTGLIYSYSGLSVVKVKKGDYVFSGDVLGSIGKKKEATLKFMVFQNGNPIDPEKAPRG